MLGSDERCINAQRISQQIKCEQALKASGFSILCLPLYKNKSGNPDKFLTLRPHDPSPRPLIYTVQPSVRLY